MDQLGNPNGDVSRLSVARELLARRGIVPDREDYSAGQLARELSRRGWRWNLDVDEASVTKAFAPLGTAEQTITVKGRNQIAMLTIVLADAIRFDEEHGLSPSGPYRADIVVRAPDDRIIAAVEVRNRQYLNSDVAMTFRRNLIADGRLNSSIPYFLLVSQDLGFLWDNRPDALPFAAPTSKFPLETVVAHYWPWYEPLERLSGEALELVVTRWLGDLARMDPDRPLAADQFFEGTGFQEAIRGATVHSGARV